MTLKIIRCGKSELEFVKEAVGCIKGEEDGCSFDELAVHTFLSHPDNWFYVAIEAEKVAAYAIAYVQRRLDTKRPMICLYEIGTLKCHRKKGLAKKILQTIMEDGKAVDAWKIWIPTNEGNTAACALYRSIGAEEPRVKDEIIYQYRY